MSELRTKIAMLYKTYVEWQTNSDYVPLKGEFCFIEFPEDEAGHKDVLFKIGNGADSFADLGYGMAITPEFE